jgi:catechol 2,3-dioxygenase-like lactoylglutathione lyase family enzyme
MLANARAYNGFAVDDLEKARDFYENTLGLRTTVVDEGNLMTLHLPGDRDTLVYVSPRYAPAPYTILNFEVEDIDATVDELAASGVELEHYDDMGQDEKGISRTGPDIAWFRDPAGNILSVIQVS